MWTSYLESVPEKCEESLFGVRRMLLEIWLEPVSMDRWDKNNYLKCQIRFHFKQYSIKEHILDL